MKWQALKEWSISFVIALVPFLLVLGALLVPQHAVLGDEAGAIAVGVNCRGDICDRGCSSCEPNDSRRPTACVQPNPNPNNIKCDCLTNSGTTGCMKCSCVLIRINNDDGSLKGHRCGCPDN